VKEHSSKYCEEREYQRAHHKLSTAEKACGLLYYESD